ncbi:MAG: hypothetical protein K8I30_06415 [Anaerolineae bacterium]|nr:hypothetical protein [Anaerolineae bacterium]
MALKLAEWAKLPPRWARLCGGWKERKRRAADFAAVRAAVGRWTATVLAVMRRAHGSDLLLRQLQ